MADVKVKTIKIHLDTAKEIENYKEYKRETWDDLLKKLLNLLKDKNG